MLYLLLLFITIAWTLANHFSTWLATDLSLFYSLKIANYTNAVFLHLKHRVEMVVLVMFLGALVLLPLCLIMISILINIQIHPYERNVTLSSKRSDTENFLKLIIFSMGDFIPFIISLMFFLLLISLLKHLKKMKHHAMGFRDPSIKAHLSAMKMVISFLMLFAVYFLSILMTAFHSDMTQNKSTLMLGQVLANAYPSVHSFVLILGNSELWRASLSVLWQLKCSLKAGKPSDS